MVGVIVGLLVGGYLLLSVQGTRSIPGSAPVSVVEPGAAARMASQSAGEPAPAADSAALAQDTTAAAKAEALVARPTRRAWPARASAPAAKADQEEEPALVVAPPVLPTTLEPVEIAPTILTMNGRVLDENGRPLAGATVMLKGSENVVSTDANGNYSLKVPAGDNTLLYGYGGYKDQVLRSRNAKNQNVTLVPKENSRRRRR